MNHKVDVLIVGGGLAGLFIALNCDPSLSIAVLTKDVLAHSSSELAQGGIAAEIGHDDGALAAHIEDTLRAGRHQNDMLATQALVHEASNNIDRLIAMGVPFDKDSGGNLLRTREGGHSSYRILHAGGDATGHEIMTALRQRILEKKNIHVFEETMLIKLMIEEEQCQGAIAIDANQEPLFFSASHTVIATGGIGGVYKNTTNEKIATGDGIAVAARAGANVRDMEFVQFHPTAFYNGQEIGKKFLMTEALRGEGGTLLNISHERFMHKYHESLELAPRDIVSQSIYREMFDTWSDHVFLDVRQLGKSYLEKRFPTIYHYCSDQGFHMEKDLIPVAPVEHFLCGGIDIDINGKTNIHYLYANGECACSGVHGANRLASNSLLECIVFGRRIATSINTDKRRIPTIIQPNMDIPYKPFDFKSIRGEIREIMDKYVGIVRTTEGLQIAQKILKRHDKNLAKIDVLSRYYYETRNMASVAVLVLEAAIARQESLGCHYRL